MIERLAIFAASVWGKWLIGAGEAALGAFVVTLVNTIGGLGLDPWLATTLGAGLGSIAGRLGIPSPPPAVE